MCFYLQKRLSQKLRQKDAVTTGRFRSKTSTHDELADFARQATELVRSSVATVASFNVLTSGDLN